MARKSRRVRRKGSGARLSETQMAQPSQTAAETPSVADVQESKSDQPATEVDLTQEYRYVVSDLRRLGLLAAAIVVSLLILYLVL